MAERCALLKEWLQALFCRKLKDCKGQGFLNCYFKEDKVEIGQLLQFEEAVCLWRVSRRLSSIAAFPISIP